MTDAHDRENVTSEEPLAARGSARVARVRSLAANMRRETIAPPTGMAPPAGWAPWVQDAHGVGGDFAEASVDDGVPTRGGTCACPVCELDLSSWTLPDREMHADACVARALEGGATVASHRQTRVRGHDRPPPAEMRAETHHAAFSLPATPSSGASSGGACEAFLRRLGLARYAPAFAREALFSSDLPSLTPEDLRDVLGVRDERDVAAILAAARSGPGPPSSDDADPPSIAFPRGAAATTASSSREAARLASLERHDVEWTHVAMAVSASTHRSAPPRGAGTSAAAVSPATRDETRDEKALAARAFRERSDAANRPERRAANPRDEETLLAAPAARTDGDRDDDVGSREKGDGSGSVLEAARSLGRRSVPSSLWGAAGHGGRDREIPRWVLGEERPRAG